MQKRVVKASDLAKLLAEKSPKGSEEMLKFGKVFEECYTTATWLYGKIMKGTKKKFIRKFAVELKNHGIYTKENVRKGYRMYSCLLSAEVTGRKPKTQFRELRNVIIAAQPDLVDDFKNRYYEFKTYSLDEYARVQSKIFSWVFGKKIHLVGLKEKKNGLFTAEEELIDGRNFEFPKNISLKSIGQLQKVCKDCMRPISYCDKRKWF